MKRKILHDISVSSIQVFINQVSGIAVFYILSRYISKPVFGEISWCLALLMLAFAILGFGIDQVVVKKIAAGHDISSLASTYLLHILVTGTLFISGLWLISLLTGHLSEKVITLLLLATGQFFIFLSLPFKQIANGKEAFRRLLLMSVGANIGKVIGLLLLAGYGRLTLRTFLIIYISASVLELVICLYTGRRFLKRPNRLSLNLQLYKSLVKESLPQLGVIICNAGIARFDWIWLGILSTTSILAEYSFAYKVFEISTLPLLVIAPLLLPRITRWFHLGAERDMKRKTQNLITLAKYEIIIACLGSMLLNIVWTPFIDPLTDNKYGSVNQYTILILSAGVPFLYVNNILWSVNFARNQMKLILSIFITSFLVTCGGDLLLIPFFHAEGAAVAYLIAIIIQTLQFLGKTRLDNSWKIHGYLLLGVGTALISGFLAKYISRLPAIQIPVAVCLYFLIISASRQISKTDYFKIKKTIWA
jgi:O-antigen/teichoic acid export membrane protein